MSDKKKKEIETCDYSDIKPEAIKFLTKKEIDIVVEYDIIIKALRKTSMTTKDIHNLYYNEEKKEHTYTIKTIYRYVEKLLKAGLIQEIGYRITKGTRLCEKLYGVTANIFYSKFVDGEDNWWEQDIGKEWSKKLSVIIGELFETQDIDHDAFYEIFKIFAEAQYKIIFEALEKSKDNQKIADVYSNVNIEKVNKLNYYMSIMTAFLRNPEIIERFLEILD